MNNYPVADCLHCKGFLLFSPLWDEWQHADTRSRTCKTGTVAAAGKLAQSW